MSRQSKDEYILPTGEIIAVSCAEQPPRSAMLYNGYNYDTQEWWYKGAKDTRTIEELQASMMSA